ncbi:Hypothetical predicted protein [Lecanosticta acicola]|uniref:Lytic polysaccharide monooxygenase n=1 Tax=Lecanosticta acicola TaxID=111012 RepID=A0AAI8Z5A4_9PEZI|nr:Hypothetical predicted protein [Lecanosticta acicola]
MQLFSALVGAAVLLATQVTAHMQLDYPAPFNASKNAYRKTAADPYLQYPYDCCGPNDRWQYPCRGYHKLLGTPQGAPTATWVAGSTANFNISGIGNHFGGSCQVGFSTDDGDTFRVATSYEGNCPHRDNGDGPDGQDFTFAVPKDIDTGVQLFAWIWYNREQEMNMNCAAVKIVAPTNAASNPTASNTATASPPEASTQTYQTVNGCTCHCESPVNITTCSCADCKGPSSKSRDVAFNSRPLMFVADNGNDCLTPHTTAELKYPDPGPDVVTGDGAYPLEPPTGACTPEEQLAKQAYDGNTGNDGHMGA